ncbi:hypothetical protein P9F83_20555 [Peribacillus psychrosaccharolyticus]|uniref:hypothetical protein n=1 Tax=Peribacillus psychrosaccharolyticus TaxID=1407 RepID=UPI001F3578FB|nr:hypothetical protein [Peribacillus psychrosaccharolyticus]MEC2057615.1 hypothetical protein [Peribacillus psychrosaccharolyticus]MED3744760.1 hypothetical protein [Peribacillus psychrosaccharolyticus]
MEENTPANSYDFHNDLDIRSCPRAWTKVYDEKIVTQGTDKANYVFFNKTHKDAQPKPRVLGPNGGRLQSHHGLQQEWAKTNLSQYGYTPNLAPTVTLETGKGLPHTTISTAQNARRNARVAMGISGVLLYKKNYSI